MSAALERGPGLWLLLLLGWGGGRVALSRLLADRWDLGAEMAVETVAVATVQWLVIGGWRRPRGGRA